MPTNQTNDNFYYEGFSSPNYTLVPDDVFDILAPHLTEAELRVFLYILRRTFGFKKHADTISLKQMVEGITTKDGRILDYGAGIAKSTAVRAVKGLIDKGIIISHRNSSQEKGDEPTTYELHFKNNDTGPVFYSETRGGSAIGHPRVLPQNTQDTVLQETDKHNIRDDDDLAALLEKFGVSKTQAQRLVGKHSPELILEKLDLVQYLQSVKSPLVAKNPQGFLVRAIDENYLPKNPKGYKSRAQREQEDGERKQEEEQIRLGREARQKAIAAFKENRPAKPIPGTNLTTKTAWTQALEILRSDLNRLNFETWLRDTAMIDYQNDEALIGAPTNFTAEWLRDRLASRVINALANVIGHRVKVDFEAVPEMTKDNPSD